MKINCDSLSDKGNFSCMLPSRLGGEMTTTAKIDFLYVILIKRDEK
jgi:hypothetical protein